MAQKSARELLDAKEIAKVRLKELNLMQRNLVKRYHNNEITAYTYNEMLMEIIELKRISSAIFYNNATLGDNKEIQ